MDTPKGSQEPLQVSKAHLETAGLGERAWWRLWPGRAIKGEGAGEDSEWSAQVGCGHATGTAMSAKCAVCAIAEPEEAGTISFMTSGFWWRVAFSLQRWAPLAESEQATVWITADSLSTHCAFWTASAFLGCGKGQEEPVLPGHQENEQAHSSAQSPF